LASASQKEKNNNKQINIGNFYFIEEKFSTSEQYYMPISKAKTQ
jgi:hypothetical protein